MALINFNGCVVYRMLPKSGKKVENTDAVSFTSAFLNTAWLSLL